METELGLTDKTTTDNSNTDKSNTDSAAKKTKTPKISKTSNPSAPVAVPVVDKEDIDAEASTGYGLVAQAGARDFQGLSGHEQMIARLAIEIAMGHVPITPVHDPCNQIFGILVRQSPFAVESVMCMTADEREIYVRTQLHIITNKVGAIRAALKTRTKKGGAAPPSPPHLKQ